MRPLIDWLAMDPYGPLMPHKNANMYTHLIYAEELYRAPFRGLFGEGKTRSQNSQCEHFKISKEKLIRGFVIVYDHPTQ